MTILAAIKREERKLEKELARFDWLQQKLQIRLVRGFAEVAERRRNVVAWARFEVTKSFLGNAAILEAGDLTKRLKSSDQVLLPVRSWEIILGSLSWLVIGTERRIPAPSLTAEFRSE
jgi:hypothetical protein